MKHIDIQQLTQEAEALNLELDQDCEVNRVYDILERLRQIDSLLVVHETLVNQLH